MDKGGAVCTVRKRAAEADGLASAGRGGLFLRSQEEGSTQQRVFLVLIRIIDTIY